MQYFPIRLCPAYVISQLTARGVTIEQRVVRKIFNAQLLLVSCSLLHNSCSLHYLTLSSRYPEQWLQLYRKASEDQTPPSPHPPPPTSHTRLRSPSLPNLPPPTILHPPPLGERVSSHRGAPSLPLTESWRNWSPSTPITQGEYVYYSRSVYLPQLLQVTPHYPNYIVQMQ